MSSADGSPPETSPPRGFLARVVGVRDAELPLALRALVYNFCLLAAYYIVRPLREEFGANDRENLQHLWTGTFVAMLVAVPIYAAVVGRWPRGVFIPAVYRFFLLNLAVFYALVLALPPEHRIWVERSFYVWTSVFNLFAVTAFWGFMADLFRAEQGTRLFGFLAAGGTVGAIAGSWLTGRVATTLPPVHLLPASMVLLELAARSARALNRHARQPGPAAATEAEAPIGGSVLTGLGAVFRSPYLLGICLYLLLFTTTSSFLYFEQSHIVGEAIEDRGRRTALFANINLAVNGLTLLVQCFLTGRIMRRIGTGATLVVLPILTVAGFGALGVAQLGVVGAAPATILAVLVTFQVLRRASNYALAKPAREVLFTVVGREEKYKSKAFIDTVVYRGGDMVSGHAFAGLKFLGLTLAGIALVTVPIAAAWSVAGYVLGRRQQQLADDGN